MKSILTIKQRKIIKEEIGILYCSSNEKENLENVSEIIKNKLQIENFGKYHITVILDEKRDVRKYIIAIERKKEKDIFVLNCEVKTPKWMYVCKFIKSL